MSFSKVMLLIMGQHILYIYIDLYPILLLSYRIFLMYFQLVIILVGFLGELIVLVIFNSAKIDNRTALEIELVTLLRHLSHLYP
jgi:hypothetical protein